MLSRLSDESASNITEAPVSLSSQRTTNLPQRLYERFSQSEGGFYLGEDDLESPQEAFSCSMSCLLPTTTKKVRFLLPNKPTSRRRKNPTCRRKCHPPMKKDADGRWEPVVPLYEVRKVESSPLPPPIEKSLSSPSMPVRRKSVDKKEKKSSLIIPLRRRSADRKEKVSNKPLSMPTRRRSVEDVSTAELLQLALSELVQNLALKEEEEEEETPEVSYESASDEHGSGLQGLPICIHR
jgi:hypothetical protein